MKPVHEYIEFARSFAKDVTEVKASIGTLPDEKLTVIPHLNYYNYT
jgi:hypothetical protein